MNIILTGIPRSGTTLVCHLLNRLPNTIALHEPHNPFHYVPTSAARGMLVDDVDCFFARTRASLLATGNAPSKQLDGHIPDNPKGPFPWPVRLLPNAFYGIDALGRWSLRRRRAHPGTVHFSKPLDSDFTLCVKHNAAYTALLDKLTLRYTCYAIIRNPVSILASWNTIDFDLREGDMTITPRLDPDLAARLEAQPDRIIRQVMIVEWFFCQYEKYIPPERVIRYEHLVENPASSMRRLVPHTVVESIRLTNENSNNIYNRRLMRRLCKTLLSRPSVIWRYYAPEMIATLCADL